MDRSLKRKPYSFLLNAPVADASEIIAIVKTSNETDEDLAKIKIPGWRYAQIDIESLNLFDKVDVHAVPLQVFDIAKKMSVNCIPYSYFGEKHVRDFEDISKDAFTIIFTKLSKNYIFFNDDTIVERINFSIMHEIGHIILGHKGYSSLAEIEANHFAVRTLCPVEILEHLKIDSKTEIARMFNVSEEFAENRIKDLESRKSWFPSKHTETIRSKIIDRFILKK